MDKPSDPDGRVEQLLQLYGNGPHVLAVLLEACVEQLRQEQQARSDLARLSTEEVQRAIARRHRRLMDPGSGS